MKLGCALAWIFLAAGCGAGAHERDVFAPAGPAARILAALGLPVVVGFVVVSAAMWALIAYVALRRTGSFAEHAPVDAEGGTGWLLIGGFIIPGIAFVGVFIATIAVLRVFPIEHGITGRAEIRVTARQWWWQIDYVDGPLQDQFVTANEIHIPVGRPIELELESADVIHSFWAPRLHGKVDLVPGIHNHIRIEADAPGVYPGACAEFCGLEHAKMRFVVVAQSKDEYERWLASQRRSSVPPADAQAQRGQALFMGGPCLTCHRIRGTDAAATVGPDLTHFAGRSTLASAWLPNQLGPLHAWIVNAPSLKPGTQMPALTFFTGTELQDLVAYLETLK
ncbi:MAG TPA: cytochrome c oxidase subunit II [Polyangia bacterium]